MPRAQRPYFVVNPNSANASTGREWPSIAAQLKRELARSTSPLHRSPGRPPS